MRPEHPLEVVKPKIENKKFNAIHPFNQEILNKLISPIERQMLLADAQGSELLQNYVETLNNSSSQKERNFAEKDLRDYVAYLNESQKEIAAKASETPAEGMASESIPGFEDIAAAKTASKSINLDDVAAEIDRLRAEGKTDTKVSVGKPGDPIEGMEQAQTEKDAAAASSAPLESELKVDPADMDSLNEVGSSDFAAALTKYKQQLLEQEKKYKHSDWKKINDDFKKITTPEELEQHKSDVRNFLKNTKFITTTNKPESKKEIVQGNNASGGTTDSNKPTPSSTPTTPPPEKGKGFGVKGMAIGAGLAGVAGYLARGNSGGNSDNDKQLLDMVRGMNPQQLRQILQQIQR